MICQEIVISYTHSNLMLLLNDIHRENKQYIPRKFSKYMSIVLEYKPK